VVLLFVGGVPEGIVSLPQDFVRFHVRIVDAQHLICCIDDLGIVGLLHQLMQLLSQRAELGLLVPGSLKLFTLQEALSKCLIIDVRVGQLLAALRTSSICPHSLERPLAWHIQSERD